METMWSVGEVGSGGGALLSLDWPCRKSGVETVVRNCKPDRADGVLYSVGCQRLRQKGKLAQIMRKCNEYRE